MVRFPSRARVVPFSLAVYVIAVHLGEAINRAEERKSQVRQCLGFSTADFLSLLAYESGDTKPEHYLT